MIIFILITKWIGIAICLGVLIGCICRIDLLDPKRHRLGWRLLYILFSAYAGGVLMDLWVLGQVDWYEGAGVAGVLLHISLTRKLWRCGPPPETLKAEQFCSNAI